MAGEALATITLTGAAARDWLDSSKYNAHLTLTHRR